ncbi:MAG TPA: YbhB/YbcL family Raf kinase inhibitor-like protein [Chitinophagales bacterium]|nr:YbhB/YbcL family Raf kinase inhibitor-like protein [Chitinophagales bacterium]
MNKYLRIFILFTAAMALFLLFKTQQNRSKLEDEMQYHAGLLRSMALTSGAFNDGGPIPIDYTAKGKNISPPLQWGNIPQDARSLAVIVTDYDAPSPNFKMFVASHWVLYNIPVSVSNLPAAISAAALKQEGISVGKNYAGDHIYTGPNPPIGVHEYYFRIYALDFANLFLANDTRDELMHAMKGHILSYGELVGRF